VCIQLGLQMSTAHLPARKVWPTAGQDVGILNVHNKTILCGL
jgi:hypothetical protein